MSRRHRRHLPALTEDDTPPPIAVVADGEPRPWISVMIPTFNCAPLLRFCLTSVLQQDLGPAEMEIVVVDDHSELDDPKAVVDELGGGRVSFVAHKNNEGPIATFNDCVRRSRGTLVHILHGDDFTFNGFYATISDLAQSHPDVAILTTAFLYVDEHGATVRRSTPVTATSIADASENGNPFQFCSTVVRRSAFEEYGGFIPSLVHTADFEMWVRASTRAGFATSSEALAAYRVFEAQHSAGLRKTAENFVDFERALSILDARGDLPASDARLGRLRLAAHLQIRAMRDSGEREALRANLAYLNARASLAARWRRRLADLIDAQRRGARR